MCCRWSQWKWTAHVLVVLFLIPIYVSDFVQGGTIGSGAATIPSGSGDACTGSIFGADDSDFADGSTAGSGAVYGRGILLDGGISSGADPGSGHVGGRCSFL